MMRVALVLVLLAGVQDKKKSAPGRYAEMDHGPFFSGTIDSRFPKPKSFIHKGVAVRLSPTAAVLYDTELLKVAAAWTGGYIGYPTGRDGIEGQQFADGDVRFGSLRGSLGWAAGTGDFKDPRRQPYGPLPAPGARYRGLHVHGDKVLFKLSVGGAEVLDHVAFAGGAFSRTIHAGATADGLRMLVCEQPGTAARLEGRRAFLDATVVTLAPGAPVGAALEAVGDRIELRIPPSGGRLHLTFGDADAPAPDLAALVAPGPGRNAAVVTQGARGTEKGAYQLDTLTVPYENPSKSYMRLAGVDFFSDGRRAAVSTMDGDVWTVEGIDDGLESLTWRRYASGLFQPLGLKIVDDVVYTLGRDQITRLHDLNKDGEADFYENFNSDCGVTAGYHEFAHDLHTDSRGNFFYAKGSDMGGAKTNYHGAVVKVAKDGSSSELWAPGLRAPNGMSVGPGDLITTSDNQGNWVPATPINWVPKKGVFCGFQPCSHSPAPPTERPAPLCWIPHAFDNSGGGQVWVSGERWGPFKDHLLHLSYGKCVLFKVLIEKKADGSVQGGVVRFPFTFASGIMRARMSPGDGQLYVVGMRGWQTSAQRDGCFQRVRYTGGPANMPLAAEATSTTLAITFSDPLDRESAASADSYSASWANVVWTSKYGSDELWPSDPKRKGREPLEVKGATLSADGRTVTLSFDALRPVSYLILKYRIQGADGSPVSQEIAYTINP